MNASRITFLLAATLFLGGCGGTGSPTFVHKEYNFSYVERVAVVPFENLTKDQGAGARATRFFVSELLATESFDVIEPGEVTRVLGQLNLVRTAELTQDQAMAMGRELGTQALFLGSIGESTTMRSGSASSSIVTLTVRLVETDTGATIWSTTQTESSRGFWSSLFGTGEKSKGEVTRECVAKSISTLIN